MPIRVGDQVRVNRDASASLEVMTKQQTDALIAALTAAGVGAHKALTVTSTKTANYNAVSGDLVPGNTSGGAFTVTLPTAAVGSVIVVTKTGTDTNKLSIAKQGGDAWLNGTPDPILLQADIRWFYGYSGGWVQVDPPVRVKLFPPVTLTDGATPALDASLGQTFRLSAAGNRTIAVPTNPTDGQVIEIEHLASGGARTLALNTGTGGFKFGTDITALTATSSGLVDIIQCRYNTTANKWWVTGYVKGF